MIMAKNGNRDNGVSMNMEEKYERAHTADCILYRVAWFCGVV